MNKLRKLSVWFLDQFFYSYMVELFEDEFNIVVQAYVGDEKVAESTMKHLPHVGMKIEFLSKSARGMLLFYKVEEITITHYGNVCKLKGHVMAN